MWSDLGYQQLPHNVTCEFAPTVLTNEWSVLIPAEISLSYPPPSSPLAVRSRVPHDSRSPGHCPPAGKSLSSPLLTSNYRTSSQTIKATVGRLPTHNYRTYGVPTIRSDLPAPRIRRVGDSTVSEPQLQNCKANTLTCPVYLLQVCLLRFCLLM